MHTVSSVDLSRFGLSTCPQNTGAGKSGTGTAAVYQTRQSKSVGSKLSQLDENGMASLSQSNKFSHKWQADTKKLMQKM
jgi:hypothetical protein